MLGSTTTTTTSETTMEDQGQRPGAKTMPDLRVLPKEEHQEGEGVDSPLGNALLIGGARASSAYNDSEEEEDDSGSGSGRGSKGLRPSMSGMNNDDNNYNNADYYYKIT
jgi:hypothetical protein